MFRFKSPVMCNRYASEKARDQLAAEYAVTGELPAWQGSDDIRPTNWAPIVALGQDRTRRLVRARWGMVDSRTGKMIPNTMNARSERLLELASWRSMFLAHKRRDGAVTPPRRCLIPFTAFYEYTDEGKTKKPWTLRVTANRVYAMAGLFRSFQPPAGLEPGQRMPEGFTPPAPAVCFTMLMCDPGRHEVMHNIHDRMPVILEEDQFPVWLGEEDTSSDDLLAMMKAYPSERMEALPTAPFASPKNAKLPRA